MSEIKALIISDLHFGCHAYFEEFAPKPNNLLNVPAKKFFIEMLNELNPEYLIISGDLTSKGSPAEFDIFQEFINDILIRTKIDVNKIITCIGNHDLDWSISSISDHQTYHKLSTKTASYSIDNKMFNFDHKGTDEYCGIKLFENAIYFILNSASFSSKLQNPKGGELGDKQLDWLTRMGDQYITDSRFKILVLHHHPYPYSYPVTHKDVSLLKESGELMDLCGKYGISLICHGHRHHPRVHIAHSTGSNSVALISAGSFSVNASERHLGTIPNMLHLVRINGRSITLYNYGLDHMNGWSLYTQVHDAVPVDPVMFIDRYYDSQAISLAADSLISEYTSSGRNKIELPRWCDLPAALKSIRTLDLSKILSEKLKLSGYELISKIESHNQLPIKAIKEDV